VLTGAVEADMISSVQKEFLRRNHRAADWRGRAILGLNGLAVNGAFCDVWPLCHAQAILAYIPRNDIASGGR
jgi:hypothetical protein